MQNKLKKLFLLTFLAVSGVGNSGCRQDKSESPSLHTSSEPSTAEKGKHPLAQKPLKLISQEKSRALLLQEGIEQAKERSLNYKHRQNISQFLPEPNLPRPKDEPSLTLKEAISDIEGKGPLRFTINTSLGKIVCSIDLNKVERQDGAAHFVTLARGKRTWWNRRVVSWSNDPFYRNTVIYKVFRGKGFYAGFPPEAGDSKLAVQALMKTDPGKNIPAYTLGMLYAKGTKLLDTNFAITSEYNTFLDLPFFPIAECGESAELINSIVGITTTGDGIPLEEIQLLDITFSRN